MNNKEIINLLQRKILDVLPSIIGKGRTILTDLPYHGNIGDILIWEGELLFLKYINAFPLSQTSSSTFMFPELDEDITICLHGGGNFGDLYRGAQEFRKKVLISYPKNRIVILPQSVWYDNKDLIEDDARLFAKHPNLYICARDNTSYEFLKHFFKANNVFLVPDMAFCIGDISDRNKATANMTKFVFIKRLDKEFVDNNIKIDLPYDIRDWPTFEKRISSIHAFLGISKQFQQLNKNNKILNRLINLLTDHIMTRWRN